MKETTMEYQLDEDWVESSIVQMGQMTVESKVEQSAEWMG
jgi:hypothetical protein